MWIAYLRPDLCDKCYSLGTAGAKLGKNSNINAGWGWHSSVKINECHNLRVWFTTSNFQLQLATILFGFLSAFFLDLYIFFVPPINRSGAQGRWENKKNHLVITIYTSICSPHFYYFILLLLLPVVCQPWSESPCRLSLGSLKLINLA